MMANEFGQVSRSPCGWQFDVDAQPAQTVSCAEKEADAAPAYTGPARPATDRRFEHWSARVARSLEVSTVLRTFGAGLMVAAIGIFLFQRWDAGSDMNRYAILLAQTFGLSGLGFVINRFMREPKSARVFVALSLVSGAASFTVLGALLYSTVQWDTVRTAYPGFAYWRADDLGQVLAWLGGSSVVLIPVTLIGYLVLARPAARVLSALFLLNCAIVLLPLRDPACASFLACAMAVVSFAVLARLRGQIPALGTIEGRIARLIALVPIFIIAARCAYLYDASALSVASCGLLGYVTVRQMAVSAARHPGLQRGLEASSLLPVLVTAAAMADFVAGLVSYRWAEDVAVAIFCLALIAALADLAGRSRTDAAVYARAAALVGLAAGLLELFVDPSMFTAIFCTVASAVVALYARAARFPIIHRLGLLGGLVGVACQVFLAIEAVDLGSWAGLTALGVVAIVLAAALERYGERLPLMVFSVLRVPAARRPG